MTTALHISIFNGTAFLWSESNVPGDIKDLRQAVKAVTFDLKILKKNTEKQFAWLPARGDLPIPSTPLLGEEPDKRRKVQLQHFPIVARPLTVDELFEFMVIAGQGNIPGSGVIYGNSVPWIRQLLVLPWLWLGKSRFYQPSRAMIVNGRCAGFRFPLMKLKLNYRKLSKPCQQFAAV